MVGARVKALKLYQIQRFEVLLVFCLGSRGLGFRVFKVCEKDLREPELLPPSQASGGGARPSTKRRNSLPEGDRRVKKGNRGCSQRRVKSCSNFVCTIM